MKHPHPYLPHVLASILGHDLRQVDCAQHVVIIIAQWVLHALIHIFSPSKVNDGIVPIEEDQVQMWLNLALGPQQRLHPVLLKC